MADSQDEIRALVHIEEILSRTAAPIRSL